MFAMAPMLRSLAATSGSSTGWNPSDASAGLAGRATFSNANRTVTFTGGGEWTLRAVSNRTSGKRYFEVLCGGTSSAETNAWEIGAISTSEPLDNSAYDLDNDAFYRANGAVHVNGFTTFVPGLASFNTGDVIGVAVDIGNSISFYKNNALQTTQTFTPADVSPFCGQGGGTDGGQTFALRTTAADQTYAPPTGFSAWD
jgi:hypothetical protein